MWVASLDGMTPCIYSSPSALGSRRKPGGQPKTGTAMTAEIIPFRPPRPGPAKHAKQNRTRHSPPSFPAFFLLDAQRDGRPIGRQKRLIMELSVLAVDASGKS